MDDLLFFPTNPLISIPNLLKELKIYEEFSLFRINYQKSEALGDALPPSLTALLQLDSPFRWATTHIRYLGILLPGRMEDIFTLNFSPLLATIKKDLQKWQHGLFSWYGRCGIVKMNILPRLLYHFQALPIQVPTAFQKMVNRVLAQFVWAPTVSTSNSPSKTVGRHGSAGCQSLPYGMSSYPYIGLVPPRLFETVGAKRAIFNRGPPGFVSLVSAAPTKIDIEPSHGGGNSTDSLEGFPRPISLADLTALLDRGTSHHSEIHRLGVTRALPAAPS